MDNGRDDLVKTLEHALRVAETWRQDAGLNTAEHARRNRLVWQLEFVVKQMLKPPVAPDR